MSPAQGSAKESEAIAIQKGRVGRVHDRGNAVHYTKRWNLDDLPSYKPEQTIIGTVRVYGLNYLTDGKLGKYWDEGFRQYHPGSRIEYYTPTALVAIPGLYFGLADIGASRKITFDELLAFQRIFSYHPTEITFVTGSYNVPGWAPTVGIFVNTRNPITQLSFPQLDGIYGAERMGGFEGTTWQTENARGPEKNIRTWGQLGLTGEWANQPINVYGRPLKYHQQARIEHRVFKGGAKWNERLREYAHDVLPDGSQAQSTRAMLSDLSTDPYGIAFADLVAASGSAGLKTLAIASKEGGPYVQPTLETSRDRTYPLHGESYMYINRKPGQPVDPKVKEFLHYILSREGQNEVQRDGKFLPLIGSMVQEQRKKLE
ncbi:MAG: substrate-binding domain-containing protein [Opitutaceae bacterium]|nr:substrate-binding domain-containing protein [Opitutaceae bacterium]